MKKKGVYPREVVLQMKEAETAAEQCAESGWAAAAGSAVCSQESGGGEAVRHPCQYHVYSGAGDGAG